MDVFLRGDTGVDGRHQRERGVDQEGAVSGRGAAVGGGAVASGPLRPRPAGSGHRHGRFRAARRHRHASDDAAGHPADAAADVLGHISTALGARGRVDVVG